MTVSLAFCRLAYEDIFGEELPGDLPFNKAAEMALAKNKARFMELYKEAGY